ncbi:hypothetical protein, variant [Spizellomyces punctatus DAOM BR117]|nr:hypothetical protein, variant [Spizellomyces punctatus DAOM BR117]KNC99785.1 hypothetical protein, variant [Spizellomyces punctatus DAOM BR117]|eukprot:XP_016607825.1 hypothetical protein, variant [Spizellomyces punctatus DAOM BR117]
MPPASVPRLLYGTAWKKDQTHALVKAALLAGFRGIDTANQPKHYNEPQIGSALQAVAQTFPRESLFIQTKFTPISGQDPNNVPYDPSAPLEEQVKESFMKSLENLQTSYVDSYVLHSPLHSLQDTLRVWRVMEDFHSKKLIRYLGISNAYSLPFLQHLHAQARVKPKFIQNRFHDETEYDIDVRSWCRSPDVDITYQSFWTLTANPHVLQSDIVRSVALKKGCTVEQVLFKCLIQSGILPLTGTRSEVHMKQDLSVLEWEDWEEDLVDRVMSLVGER